MIFVFTLLGVTRPPSPPHNQLLDYHTHKSDWSWGIINVLKNPPCFQIIRMRTESGKINCCSKVAKYHDDVSAWQLCGFCQKNPKHQFPTQSKYLLCFLKYIHFWQLNDSLLIITIAFRKYHFGGVWFSGHANASNERYVCPTRLHPDLGTHHKCWQH